MFNTPKLSIFFLYSEFKAFYHGGGVLWHLCKGEITVIFCWMQPTALIFNIWNSTNANVLLFNSCHTSLWLMLDYTTTIHNIGYFSMGSHFTTCSCIWGVVPILSTNINEFWLWLRGWHLSKSNDDDSTVACCQGYIVHIVTKTEL